MNDIIHLIIVDREDSMGYVTYYAGESTKMPGGGYGGGFVHDISNAITFDNIMQAHIKCQRLATIYVDIPAKIRVITMTTKELFKAKLGG